jgi:hypothetical protein
MAPPTATEQLIRDYLNRLSVAARDLAADDRRALLERTRSLIDQKVNLARRPSTMDVGRVLARLGDPAVLVEQERRRLVAQGKAVPRSTPAAPRQRFLARTVGREHARPRGPGFPWSAMRDNGGSASFAQPNGVSNGVEHRATPTTADSPAARSEGGESAGVPVADAAPSAGTAANGLAAADGPVTASDGPAAGDGPTSAADGPAREDGPLAADGPAPADQPGAADRAVPAHSPPSDADAVNVGPAQPRAESPPRRRSAFVAGPVRRHSHVDDQSADDATSPPATEGARDSTAPRAEGARDSTAPRAEAAGAGPAARAGPGAATRDNTEAAPGGGTASGRSGLRVQVTGPDGAVRRQIGRVLGWARKRPLEAAAVALMGVGGPIFPPVFLIGATLALASELWDGRDKWVGLALPIVLTLIGLILGIAAGGRAHWQHEGWVYLDIVSRVAPMLGAGYLAWRSERPRRPPAVPPFIRPRGSS